MLGIKASIDVGLFTAAQSVFDILSYLPVAARLFLGEWHAEGCRVDARAEAGRFLGDGVPTTGDLCCLIFPVHYLFLFGQKFPSIGPI